MACKRTLLRRSSSSSALRLFSTEKSLYVS
jgi:hypothetical protein